MAGVEFSFHTNSVRFPPKGQNILLSITIDLYNDYYFEYKDDRTIKPSTPNQNEVLLDCISRWWSFLLSAHESDHSYKHTDDMIT